MAARDASVDLQARHALLMAFLGAALALPSVAAELPMPCVAGSCGTVTSFVSSGIARAATQGTTLTVTQDTDAAVLNWRNFNISRDGKVQFVQPGAGSIALNRIYDGQPSRILGALEANGRVFLLNQNGIVFGEGAAINVGGLLASTLDLSPAALTEGLTQAAARGEAALVPYRDDAGAALASGSLQIEKGATISTPDGGSVLLFAPQIQNQGTIRTPGGQAVLAAGETVYLATSTDPNLRGLLVEVGTGGTVTNGAAGVVPPADAAATVGQIIAERGNVTLAGLAVNQNGRVSATTAVTQNGSIVLKARDGGQSLGGATPVLVAPTAAP
jgi:filamentous hemagglutinin family protein